MNEATPFAREAQAGPRVLPLRIMSATAAFAAIALTAALSFVVLRSAPSEIDLLGVSSLAIVLGLVWLGVGMIVLEAKTHGTLKVGKTGFVPQVRPLAHVLRGRKWIPYRDVASCAVFDEAGQWTCAIRLLDGTLVEVSQSQGVPKEGVAKLAQLLGSSLPEPPAFHRGADVGSGRFTIVMEKETFRSNWLRNSFLASVGVAVTMLASITLTLRFRAIYDWSPRGLAPAMVVVFLTFTTFLTAQTIARNVLGRPFRMENDGFLPRFVPMRRALARNEFVMWGEITSCLIVKSRAGWYSRITLKGDTVIKLNEKDGVPRKAIEELANRVPATVADLDRGAV